MNELLKQIIADRRKWLNDQRIEDWSEQDTAFVAERFAELKETETWNAAIDAAAVKWISVDERLPEKTEGFYVCLIFRKDQNVRQSMYNTKTKRFQDMNFHDIHDSVTHWMPLPEPPKTI